MSLEDKSVLFVDDEPSILQALKRMLRKEEYRIFTANSGPEGLEIMKNNDIQLIVSDHRMPEMTGVQFHQKVKELYPNTIRVILSGYANVNVLFEAVNKGEIDRFLAKPWNDDELKTTFRQCLEHYDQLMQNQSPIEQMKDEIKDKAAPELEE